MIYHLAVCKWSDADNAKFLNATNMGWCNKDTWQAGLHVLAPISLQIAAGFHTDIDQRDIHFVVIIARCGYLCRQHRR